MELACSECQVWVFAKVKWQKPVVLRQSTFATAGGAAIIFVAIMTHTVPLLLLVVL